MGRLPLTRGKDAGSLTLSYITTVIARCTYPDGDILDGLGICSLVDKRGLYHRIKQKGPPAHTCTHAHNSHPFLL